MNVQTEKLSLIKWIVKLEDQAMIEKLSSLRQSYSQYDEQQVSLKKEELESINRGLKDFEDGRTHPHDEVRKVYEKYL